MTLHRERIHPEYVEGCYGCKIGGVSFGSVPGGTRPGSARLSFQRSFDQDMNAYREARRHGLRPDRVSKEAVRKAEQRQEILGRAKEKVEVA